MRPIELLARTGCLSERTTIVHATHADDTELDLLAANGCTVCVCPTTEADLGDGYVRAGALLERGIAIAIGSDSNARIDPFEELRELEGIARRESLRRGVFAPAALLEIGSADVERARSVWRTGLDEIDSGTGRSRASPPSTSRRRWLQDAGADVVVA